MLPIKYWEIIADKLHVAGWSWGYCSVVIRDGWRWIVDAHREGRRYIVQSDELVTAFLELEATFLDFSAPSIELPKAAGSSHAKNKTITANVDYYNNSHREWLPKAITKV
jgi:hypothetical protein